MVTVFIKKSGKFKLAIHMLEDLFALKEDCQNLWLSYNGAQNSDLLAVLHI